MLFTAALNCSYCWRQRAEAVSRRRTKMAGRTASARPTLARMIIQRGPPTRCRLQTRKWSRPERSFGHAPVRLDAVQPRHDGRRKPRKPEPPCRQIWGSTSVRSNSLARAMSPASTAANMRSIASRYSLCIASTSLIRHAVGGLAQPRARAPSPLTARWRPRDVGQALPRLAAVDTFGSGILRLPPRNALARTRRSTR